jgi:hypothetical protein
VDGARFAKNPFEGLQSPLGDHDRSGEPMTASQVEQSPQDRRTIFAGELDNHQTRRRLGQLSPAGLQAAGLGNPRLRGSQNATQGGSPSAGLFADNHVGIRHALSPAAL